MKKMMKFFSFIAVAAMSLTACQNDIVDEQVNNNEGVTLEIIADAPTRSAFGELNGNAFLSTWTGNESVRFVANGGTAVDVTPDSAGATTRFEVTFTDGTDVEGGTIYAMSPVGDYKTDKGGWGTFYSQYGYVYLTVPTTQTPLENSVDEAAHILFAEHKYEGAFPTSSANVQFKHALAYGKMTLKMPEGVEIANVAITFPSAVAGPSIKYYHTAYGDYQAGDYTSANQNTITLLPTNVKNNVFWFGIQPIGTLTGNTDITVTATDGQVYTKTIETADEIAFERGRVLGFTVNMAACTPIEPETFATIDFTVQGFDNATAVSTVNDDANMFCATFDKGTNNNAPTYYNNNVDVPAVRVYGGSTMTISALQSFQLDKIVLTYGTGDKTNSISADSGSFDTDTWTATEDLTTSVTFTIGGTSGHRRISKVDIYYSEAVIPFSMSAENLTIPYAAQDGTANVSISGADDYTFTVTSNAEWLTVQESLNESNQVVFSATENTSTESRIATITITATNGSATETATFTITQTEGLKIVTIEEFLEAAVSDVVVYQITGVISNITNTTFGNFDLTDETGTVYIYGIKDADGNNIWSSLGLVDGDTLTIQGNRGEYNSSPQMVNGVYVSHDVNNTSRILSISNDEINFNATASSQDVTVTVAGNAATLSAIASESWITAVPNGTTVSISVSENTLASDRTGTVTITYGETSETVTVNQVAAGATATTEVTYTFSSYTAGTQYATNEVHKLDDILTITTTKCHFTTQLRIYSSSTNDGYAIGKLAKGTIAKLGFNMGYKVDNLIVYGSTDGTTWTEVGTVATTSTSYADYSLDFGDTNYTYFKLDVKGSSQIRIASLTLTYAE